MSAAQNTIAGTEVPAEDRDVGLLRRRLLGSLTYSVGKEPKEATDHDWFVATAYFVRNRIVERWIASSKARQESRKHVYYLSLEFLIGRLLLDSLNSLGLTDAVRDALAEFGVDLATLQGIEPDAALGNGGLGRLAACFMESMATLAIPAYGYGIRYNHGLFRQVIQGGVQLEYPEDWLSFRNPWEFERPEVCYSVGFGGYVEAVTNAGQTRHLWRPGEMVVAVAYDT